MNRLQWIDLTVGLICAGCAVQDYRKKQWLTMSLWGGLALMDFFFIACDVKR